ncbi:DNA mismatch repair protein [Ceratobasidium sp. 370]|nr:DNA mismatch repair protein [Ceratobasidium sp. 370]
MDHTRAGQKNRILTIPRTASSLATFRALYGRALVEHAEEINLRSEDLGLEGFISLGGSQSRGFQNFYVNRHPMAFGDIQRAVEKCFASSTFSRFASDERTGPYNLPHTRRSPKKVERKPIYVLNLSISPSQVDNFVEPAKSMVQFQDTNRVLAFVLEVVNRFLDRNNLLSTQPRPAETSLGSPRKRLRREDAQSSSRYSQQDHFVGSMPNVRERALPPHKLPETISSHPAHIIASADGPPAILDDSGYFEWTDPSSGESFLVDSNSGNSFPRNRLPDHIRKGTPTSAGGVGEDVETPCFDRRSLRTGSLGSESRAEKPHKIPEWLVKAMQAIAQQNPTFHFTEPEVFSTRSIDPSVQRPRPHAHAFTSWGNIYTSNLSQSSKPASDTFSTGDLKSAQVIAQVDTKFIACLLQRPDRILALVDQHAADERVRVERYLKRLCAGFLRGEVEVLKMEKPRRVLLTRREAEILQGQGVLDSLERWGLWLELNVPTSQQGPSTQDFEFAQVDVTGVPDVIASKLAAERELGAFVRSMVATVETNESTPWPTVSSNDQGDKDWVKALRYCPAPLLELVNSKACRGAIMFNDPLDLSQCEHLIQQLSETVFPFQCAHGRPSIAPLTKVAGPKPRPVVVDWEAFDQDDK